MAPSPPLVLAVVALALSQVRDSKTTCLFHLFLAGLAGRDLAAGGHLRGQLL